MSYCRASSDDFRCDLYIYQSFGGWVTHVSARRNDLPDEAYPPPLPWGKTKDEHRAWYDRHQTVMAMINDAELVPIDLPHAGESFCDDTPGECADRAESLRALGYRVPQYAIDSLRAEQEG